MLSCRKTRFSTASPALSRFQERAVLLRLRFAEWRGSMRPFFLAFFITLALSGLLAGWTAVGMRCRLTADPPETEAALFVARDGYPEAAAAGFFRRPQNRGHPSARTSVPSITVTVNRPPSASIFHAPTGLFSAIWAMLRIPYPRLPASLGRTKPPPALPQRAGKAVLDLDEDKPLVKRPDGHPDELVFPHRASRLLGPLDCVVREVAHQRHPHLPGPKSPAPPSARRQTGYPFRPPGRPFRLEGRLTPCLR